MITPAYAPTATERVLPRLALDFTTGTLDPRVTVARALNTATRVNSSGFIETVNADLPRFDYDPVTLAPKGLLIEETRTNILPYSNDFRDTATAGSTRPWVYDNATIVPAAAISPDGTQNASKLVENNASSAHAVRQTVTTVASTTYAPSIFVKGDGSGRNTRVYAYQSTSPFNPVGFATINLANGAVLAGAGTVAPWGNGWYRVSFSGAAPSTGTVFRVDVANGTSTNYQGDGTSGVYIWGAQLEAGAFATSYIPTTTTSLTRNADAVTMTGTNFSSWYNVSEGTLVGEYTTYPVVGSGKYAYGVSDGSTSNFISQRQDSARVQTLGSTVAAMNSATILPNTTYKSVIAYKTDNFAADANAQLLYTDTSGAVPTVNQLMLGDLEPSTNRRINCWMRKFNFYPQRLINPEVTAFSK